MPKKNSIDKHVAAPPRCAFFVSLHSGKRPAHGRSIPGGYASNLRSSRCLPVCAAPSHIIPPTCHQRFQRIGLWHAHTATHIFVGIPLSSVIRFDTASGRRVSPIRPTNIQHFAIGTTGKKWQWSHKILASRNRLG